MMESLKKKYGKKQINETGKKKTMTPLRCLAFCCSHSIIYNLFITLLVAEVLIRTHNRDIHNYCGAYAVPITYAETVFVHPHYSGSLILAQQYDTASTGVMTGVPPSPRFYFHHNNNHNNDTANLSYTTPPFPVLIADSFTIPSAIPDGVDQLLSCDIKSIAVDYNQGHLWVLYCSDVLYWVFYVVRM
eukprot:TRINITY_DN10193_c0_g1_i1.p1 TRINITY_DN10193_c0_g1~~TRINITY_DN10193_c0_g1_i1.p1  ORF type:complete len:188 (-),score=19.12 TRINITY_DN10193_c0_g1_i1:26-589(-)